MAAYVAAPIGVRSTVVVGSRTDGDFRPGITNESRRRRLIDGAWTMLTEEHGAVSRVVDSPGRHDGETGDALFTTSPGAVLGVWVGDCAPVALVGDVGVGIAHAGWRGVRDGVLESLVECFVAVGDQPRSAVIGPHLQVCCNEFGADDLDTMADRFGRTSVGVDSRSRPALDLRAVLQVELSTYGIEQVVGIDLCTRCRSQHFYSHRAGDPGRQVMAVVIDEESGKS